MKKLFTVLLLLAVCLALQAQDFTKVKGVVVDASGTPIVGATVTAVGTKVSTRTGSGGSFELMVPSSVRYVRVQKSMYLAKNAAVSGSMRVSLEIDKEAAERAAAEKAAAAKAAAEKARIAAEKARLAAEKAKAEEEARARAAEEARQKAIRDSIAQVEKEREKERIIAEARIRVAAEMRAKAIRDSLAQVEKERLEAEARARAAEEARQQAIRDSIARVEARQQAIRDSIAAVRAREIFVRDSIAAAEARAIFVRDSIAAALKQQKKDAKKAADAEYDARFRNRGIENTIEFGYAYQLPMGKMRELRYLYSGYRSMSALHPVFVDYTLSYRFNRIISIGIGAGFIYNLKSIVIENDIIVGTDEGWKEKRFDIPVYLDIKTRFGRKAVRPLLDIKGGFYPVTKSLFIDGGLGLEVRTSKRTAINLTASVRTTPFFEVDFALGSPKTRYAPCLSPSARLGFAF